eukprot:gnl/MRDRNA2_/MRDRNA2_19737_c0_seq1.p1 gnl/MRDRNA2_/MRDRNA2_19737_c0~~gnl/MRDRNA2_/MRDRNA2_19737_c0_seq1.p1  ORF type:complete len:139 (+),score=22.90 gnl/MRDRNA2_/MRDRNA2_19737_c0_seq1:42-419(+)
MVSFAVLSQPSMWIQARRGGATLAQLQWQLALPSLGWLALTIWHWSQNSDLKSTIIMGFRSKWPVIKHQEKTAQQDQMTFMAEPAEKLEKGVHSVQNGPGGSSWNRSLLSFIWECRAPLTVADLT